MKEIASYQNSLTAHFARTRLENAGIRAIVTDEMDATGLGLIESGAGIKLRVAPEDAERALAVLFGAAAPREVVCPLCDSDDTGGSGAPVFLALIVFAFTLGLLKPKRRCNACGHEWRG